MMLLLSPVTQTGRLQQTKKGFDQHEKSAVHRSAVSRFVEVPNSTDDIVGAVTKKSARNPTKKTFHVLRKF